MRKLVLTLTVAVLTSGATVFAANDINTNNVDEIVMVATNDDFKEIEIKELPEAVSTSISRDFSTATVVKAYLNDSKQYKIELTADGTKGVVYLDKEGNWLKGTDIITAKEEGDFSEEKTE
ncbi:hypothetical protein QWY81_17025 [Polaribacter undariae]|uniref:Beta-lactamase-inhibitor-like PepSY-like domain-containing protein n=1 Tax=Polaribacter sejongensis TaxID=985043 RepID=A0AAJ1QZL8_9FLAO|nr:hypothetical protein [Polaribacter undariae]MDN3621171.1 hypothetical protein [Polaribacter undariae]UWD31320.1 hypothetical protein NQP51_14405 [Polaribacter undariae]